MPATSLVKFFDRKSDGRRHELHWGRSDLDGAPFRGEPELLTTEEYDDRAVQVRDPKNRIFNLSDPAENTAYLAVLDAAYNGWFQITDRRRVLYRNKKTGLLRVEVYLEWLERYMEDGKLMHSQMPYTGRPNDD